LKIIYASEKLKTVCTSAKAAKKFFGGNDALARSLMSRINEIARFVRIVEITEVSKHYE
jgi:hypothetical protein